jgi:hypothetical protein
MITLNNLLLTQTTLLLVIWDLVNLEKNYHINQMITLSELTLSGFHCITYKVNRNFSVSEENPTVGRPSLDARVNGGKGLVVGVQNIVRCGRARSYLLKRKQI